MKKQIFSAFKITVLAIVLSFGLSYVYAWTAPSATPPTGNVSAPINTSGTAQTKTGGLTLGALYNGANGGISGAVNPVRFIVNSSSTPSALTLGYYSAGYGLDLWVDTAGLAPIYFDNRNEDPIIFRRKTYTTPVESMRIDASGLGVTGTIKASGGFIGNGPVALTPHYVNRSEDTYGGAFNYHRYCNGWVAHDTCNGDYNNLFTCGKSANIASCTDTYPTTIPRTDTGWCGSYFYDRTVSCRINEVLSTYDDNI